MQLVSGLFHMIFGGGKSKAAPAQPLPQATRDDAAAVANRQDEINRRRGSVSDMIVNGSAGAEAAMAPGKLVLGN